MALNENSSDTSNVFILLNNIFDNTSKSNRHFAYDRYKFLESNPAVAISSLVVLGLAIALGTFGNILTLLMVTKIRTARNVENIFIVNLAISDSLVTTIANPMSIIAKVEGQEFFDRIPWLCQTVGSLCTVSCVTSLSTIGMMSANRYIYICVHEKYDKIFTKFSCICICISLYLIGGFLVVLNAVGIGDHGFDHKSIDCIIDRMALYSYTVVFSVVLVWIPSVIIGACYFKIYLYVWTHNQRIKKDVRLRSTKTVRSNNLAKTCFIIYAVFLSCWAPFAILIVVDAQGNFSYEIHLYITLLAHLHPSLNWIIYYSTNSRFAEAYNKVFAQLFCCIKPNLATKSSPGTKKVQENK